MELSELAERIVADDIRIQDKERRAVLSENLFRKLERPCSSQGLSLNRKLNIDIIFLFVLIVIVSIRNLCAAEIL